MCGADIGTLAARATNGLPGFGFPGVTAEESNKAWPSGKQPVKLENWPKLLDGKLQQCWKTSPLEDHGTGWPGKCTGLEQKSQVYAPDMISCMATCQKDAFCSNWQFIAETGCKQGRSDSLSCWNADYDLGYELSGAQRVLHGAVRVLKDISCLKVKNLLNVGVWPGTDQATGIVRCRERCYADVRCQYWQYGSLGCSVESPPDYVVEFPLTLTGATPYGDEALTMIKGEYIQHHCPLRAAADAAASGVQITSVSQGAAASGAQPSGNGGTTGTEGATKSDDMSMLWRLGGAAILIGVIGGVVGCWKQFNAAKGNRTRGQIKMYQPLKISGANGGQDQRLLSMGGAEETSRLDGDEVSVARENSLSDQSYENLSEVTEFTEYSDEEETRARSSSSRPYVSGATEFTEYSDEEESRAPASRSRRS